MTDLDRAIILAPTESLFGESPESLQAAIDLGVLYICTRNDGKCPLGAHSGGVVLHLCDDMTLDDLP